MHPKCAELVEARVKTIAAEASSRGGGAQDKF